MKSFVEQLEESKKQKVAKREALYQQLKGGLIVSCQALKGEPLYVEEKSIMYLMARAAKQAGAVGIRTESARDVKAIREETHLPVIGLIKIQYEGYASYITPTLKEVEALVEAGADVIAFDATLRERGDQQSVASYIASIHKHFPEQLLMADIATEEEGLYAEKAGVDFVGTTMSGYTPQKAKTEGPDFALVRSLSSKLTIPLLAEGRIHTPEQAKQALQEGAFAVVVGGAITRPLEITQRFIAKLRD